MGLVITDLLHFDQHIAAPDLLIDRIVRHALAGRFGQGREKPELFGRQLDAFAALFHRPGMFLIDNENCFVDRFLDFPLNGLCRKAFGWTSNGNRGD